jgi:hypothetical protein
VVGDQVRGGEITARRQGGGQGGEDLRRAELVRDEVQDRDQDQRDGLAEVEHLAHHGRGQDGFGIAQVGVDVGGPPFRRRGEQGAGVREHERVVVDVHDAGRRRGFLGDLVDVVRGGQPGTDVEELPDAGFGGQVPDGAAEECPVLSRRDPDERRVPQHLRRRLPVGREVILAADEVVVHPGGMGPGRVDLGRRFLLA